jgi:DNA polymerase sigma
VIDKIYSRLSEKSATYDKYRKIGVNRIGYILEKLHLSFQVYGSYACGVTTPESDVDICIDPTIVHFFYASFSSYRQKIHMSLEFLRHAFEQYPWTKNFTLITTATVPILMFVSY